MPPDTVTLREFLDSMCDARMRHHVALVHHCEEMVEALEKTTAEKFMWLDSRTRETSSTLEKRLEGMNEFRDALKDQTGTFVTRAEHAAYQQAIDNDVRVLRESRAELRGMATQESLSQVNRNAMIAFIIGVIGAVSGIASIIRSLLP